MRHTIVCVKKVVAFSFSVEGVKSDKRPQVMSAESESLRVNAVWGVDFKEFSLCLMGRYTTQSKRLNCRL